jgi:hypothetical protein
MGISASVPGAPSVLSPPPSSDTPLEFRCLKRRGEVLPTELFLQRRIARAARREDEQTQRRLAAMIRRVRNEALVRGDLR